MKKISLDAPAWGVFFLMLIWGIALMLFSSCYNIKKAEKQTYKALAKFPVVVAKIARDSFPCYVIRAENKIDSAEFKKWKDSVNILNDFYDDLFKQIQPVVIHDTTNHCKAYKDNEIKFMAQIENQKKLISELNNKIDNTPPIKDSTKNWFKDSADMKILQSIIDDQDKDIYDRNINIAKLQAKSNADSETIKTKNKWLLYLSLALFFIIILLILNFTLKWVRKSQL